LKDIDILYSEKEGNVAEIRDQETVELILRTQRYIKILALYLSKNRKFKNT